MENIFEILIRIAVEIFGFLVRIFVEVFVEKLFKYVFYNLGYYTLKVLALGTFPKNREAGDKIHSELAVLGIFIFLISLYFLWVYYFQG